MTIAVQALIQPKFASTVLTSEYAAQSRTVVDKFSICNVGAGAAWLTVHVVPPSGSPGNDNTIAKTFTLAPSETANLASLMGQVIEAGSSIWCVSSAGLSLVLFASGRVIT